MTTRKALIILIMTATFLNSRCSIASDTQDDTVLRHVSVSVNGHTFDAVLFDNEASRGLVSMLPLDLEMRELNSNEKYGYLPDALPTSAQRIDTIHSGDLMLYGSDCLVLFYRTFATTYRYTPIGRLTSPASLSDILGPGNATVTFTVKE